MLELEITTYRKRFFVSIGKTRLSRGFKQQEEAQKDLEKNKSFYLYWSKSAGVSVENTTPIIKHI